MASLRSLASRKRRRASTTVEADAGVPDTAENHSGDDARMLDDDASPSQSLWSASTNGDATAAGTPASTCGSRQPRTKFIIGLDYGTTFSSVSYVKFDPDNPPLTLRGEQIRSVTHWPGAANRSRNPDVPSESWYLGDQFHWGYGARKATMASDDDNLDCRNRIIQYAKLLLPGDQKDTRGPRQELKRTLHKAKKDEVDVTRDYLFEVMAHTKKFLGDREGLDAGCEVELVLCVPAGWPHKAIRTMQEILLDIARRLELGDLAPPYVLNEPEAAAAYILEAGSGTEKLTAGEVFIVCDAGGGTVDAITYKVDQERPFRVQEVVSPTGSNCGSSYVNQALKEKVINRIKSTPYKSLPGASVEYTIENWLMTTFEYDIKREFLPEDGLEGNMVLAVPGLRRNEKLGFGSGTIHIARREVASLFTSSLQGISKLISQQIRAVASKGLNVEKILLTGGFSEAPIFRAHIEAEFKGLKPMYAPKRL
ncbi:hypothetical protein ASPVEDRAFT_43457 [Aspergillus versicolor CBS 583.65]|uniref:Actin-like ATPase domain-containing protein n=1 Tax=Aspergillus versicolor CBS 583.65 TaxID=1036611 RepID=A0A1L9PRF7_ASPVE|nr:uncharacterized protein ASPVEDRAFT_43457 [Aspergillus versicolor CBS 583.65]OJJ04015.1 hypothetical protein ASPVEDRAFT_43457 [Aspergillus versicolor CBS 583.65]